MIDPLEQLQKYGRLGVVIDTNLLLLFFLGSYDRRQVDVNPRLEMFSQRDFEYLVQLLNRIVKRIVTTPNILTEVSNLSNAIPERHRKAYFASFLDRLAVIDEQHVPSTTALGSRWAEFGLTDAAIAEIARNKYLVLTDDFRLSQSLQSAGIDTLNFNHLRSAYWGMSGGYS
jgi:rRNA-processing protein FCF1